ncbi:MAG: crossover junction endodeoxyribonuclease RuvC [Anaerolineae bacterium]|nr:crossover junction endodeoxyribonuclease RuvC [Anaerolineae bacterium]
MLVLGLDPGLATMGYGLATGDGQELRALDYGVIRTAPDLSLPQRLLVLRDDLQRLLKNHRPDAAAVEKLYFATNARTAFVVGQARGVILLTLAEANIPIAEYTPLQIKQAATGYGQAEKRQVQEMVRLLFGLDEVPRPDDAADALAVCLCHLHSSRFQAAAARADAEVP